MPCHNNNNGVTTNRDTSPENMSAIINTDIKQANPITIAIPTAGLKGIIRTPTNTRPSKIDAIAKVNLANLTTIKQMSIDNRIVNSTML
jgi:hypothetical protein